MIKVNVEVLTKNIFDWFIGSQTHFGTYWHVKNEFGSNETMWNVCHSNH